MEENRPGQHQHMAGVPSQHADKHRVPRTRKTKTTITQTPWALQRASEHLDITAAQTAAGRLNCATMIYPLMRPFLQPSFAWVTALLKRETTDVGKGQGEANRNGGPRGRLAPQVL